jgi:hypothetical protein
VIVPVFRPTAGEMLVMVGGFADSVAVAVKVTECEPVVAVRVFDPVTELSIQLPTVAIPSLPVVCSPPDTEALAGIDEKITVVPLTGLLKASITLTLGGVVTAVPIVADCASPAFFTICVAGPAVPVAENTKDVVLFAADAVSVFDPAAVPSFQLPTVATPSEPVVSVSPVAEPPPVVTVKVTSIPSIGAFAASLTTTLGGVDTAVSTMADWLFPAFSTIEFADTGTASMVIRTKNPAR